AVEHLATARGQLEVRDATHQALRLSRLELELQDRERRSVRASVPTRLHEWPLRQVEHTRLARLEIHVIRGGYRQGHRTRLETLEIDRERRRRLLLARSPFAPFGGWRRLGWGGLLIAAARRHRRGRARLQRHGVDLPRYRLFQAGHVEPAVGERGVGAGGEIQLLTAGIKDRVDTVAGRVGSLV